MPGQSGHLVPKGPTMNKLTAAAVALLIAVAGVAGASAASAETTAVASPCCKIF